MDSAALETVQAWLREAPQIAVLTGAGVSAESGVPTFRDAQTGYWAQFRPEDMATEEGFRAQPALVWRWYQHRRQLLQGVQPNAAHLALAAFAQQHPGRLTLITQNVDGLHRAAGSRNVIEIHGTVHRLHCMSCGQGRRVEDYAGLSIPPECPRCGGILRPDVVLFGEALPELAIERLESVLSQGMDAVVSIGTTSVFPYIAGPVLWAAREGTPTVEINPGDTQVSQFVDHRLRMCAAEALPELWWRMHPADPAEDRGW